MVHCAHPVQVLRGDAVGVTQRKGGRGTAQFPFIPRESVVKWNRKTTNMRISVSQRMLGLSSTALDIMTLTS